MTWKEFLKNSQQDFLEILNEAEVFAPKVLSIAKRIRLGSHDLHDEDENEILISYLQLLDQYTLGNIFYFLGAEDACSLRQACRLSEEGFQLSGDNFWRFSLVQQFGADRLPSALVQSQTCYSKYLDLHATRLDAEWKHVASMKSHYEALFIYYAKQFSFGNNSNNNYGVYGLVGDIFWTDDEITALVLSKLRSFALQTLIVDTEETVCVFKRLTGLGSKGPASFLPLSCLKCYRNLENYHNFLPAEETSKIPGFIGYSVDLLKMRPEHEHLAGEILPYLFKNLMVFRREVDRIAFEEQQSMRLHPGAERQRTIALDSISDEELNDTSTRLSWRHPRRCYYRDYTFGTADGGSPADSIALAPETREDAQGIKSMSDSTEMGTKTDVSAKMASMYQGTLQTYVSPALKRRLLPLYSYVADTSDYAEQYIDRVIEDLRDRSGRAHHSAVVVRYSY